MGSASGPHWRCKSLLPPSFCLYLLALPQIDSAPQKDGDGGNGVASIYLAIVNLVVIGGYLVAKKAQKGELDDLLPLLVETKEGETDEEKEEPVSIEP